MTLDWNRTGDGRLEWLWSDHYVVVAGPEERDPLETRPKRRKGEAEGAPADETHRIWLERSGKI